MVREKTRQMLPVLIVLLLLSIAHQPGNAGHDLNTLMSVPNAGHEAISHRLNCQQAKAPCCFARPHDFKSEPAGIPFSNGFVLSVYALSPVHRPPVCPNLAGWAARQTPHRPKAPIYNLNQSFLC